MLDNVLIATLRTIIIQQETAAGIPGLPIKQAFQPIQTGVDKTPAAYFHIMDYDPVGSPLITDTIIGEGDDAIIQRTTMQQYITDFQISALATQNPNTPTQWTAGDILKGVVSILQNQETVALLQENGIGIMKIGRIVQPYLTDDRQRFEAAPNVSFRISNKQIVVTEVPVIESYKFGIYPV